MLAGVDEAGRGPVLGPLVVAGVAVEKPSRLWRMGIRDSKLLRPAARERAAERIRRRARCEVRVVPAEELNRSMATATLNAIEAWAFAEVLAALAPTEAVVDACDTDAARFGGHIARLLPPPGFPLRSEHHADGRHLVVGAASIIAKVTRDALVRGIEDEVGLPVGSGYAHDPVTRAFLAQWRAERGGLPPHTRLYWATVAGDRPLDRRLGAWEPGPSRRTPPAGATDVPRGPADAGRGGHRTGSPRAKT